MEQMHYTKNIEVALFQGKDILVENLVPVLSPEQREKRKQEIELQLYDVFRKYHRGMD